MFVHETENGHRILFPEESEIFQVEESFAKLKEVLSGTKEIICDLSEVKSIDTTFIQLLLLVRQEMEKSGGKACIENVSGDVETALRLYGIQ